MKYFSIPWLLSLLVFTTATDTIAAEAPAACGRNGSIADRIRDCSNFPGSLRGNFVLVTRTRKGEEIYQDTKTGYLWSDIRRAGGLGKADRICRKAKKGLFGNLEESITWIVPSRRLWDEAHKNGISDSLPRMNVYFWTSDIYDFGTYVFLRGIYVYQRWGQVDDPHVRCVGRVKP